MFCPNCGNPDQQSDSYCRQCGEFILNLSSKFYPLNIFLSGNISPERQINISLFISSATALASMMLIGFLIGYYEAHFERTGESAPAIIYAVYLFLAVIAFWQVLSAVIGLQMKSKFSRRKNIEGKPESDIQENNLSSAKPREFLPDADMSNMVDASVTDNTTKTLNKIPRQ